MKTFMQRRKAGLICAAIFAGSVFTGCSTEEILPVQTEELSGESLAAVRQRPPRAVDERLAGGATTVFLTDENAFSQAAPNLNAESLRRHDAGDEAFAAEHAPRPTATNPGGLGPIFHHVSCEGCHVGDGRGKPSLDDKGFNSLLLRLSQMGTDAHGEPLGITGFGGQLQDQAVAGVQPEGKFSIAYTEQPGTFTDGGTYSLRSPRYQIQNTYLPFPAGVQISPRIASPVFGLGLLEAIPEETIVAGEDVNDRNNDGISGKVNRVWDVQAQRVTLGRFGWKANQPSLRQQNAGAYNGDMGVTTSLFPTESSAGQMQAIAAHPPEVNDRILNDVVHYTRTLGVPARRNVNDASVQRGKLLFDQAKCSACHTPSMQTGNLQGVPEVSNQTIFAYTDMLLHDMGEGLADNRPDFLANGREWRTTPLWGLGLTAAVNGHTFLLHDGRARNIMEAILWHGGEALASRDYVRRLPKGDRDALMAFLNSL
ncbi:MAG: c-type cytochrome [Candidatus Kapabacteria bacterium]|nr:c-type cytochrome [Candidatus Kapabacteria bacterium]